MNDPKQCKICKHAEPLADGGPFPPEYLECQAMSVEQPEMGFAYYRMYEAFLTDGNLIVSPDFGCVMWEAKNE